MSKTEWDVQDGAIVERPREVRKHPLLARIYEEHDAIISEYLRAGQVMEIAFGQHMHPEADVGVEAWPSNAKDARKPAVAGDARSLPFEDDAFETVIGRRFLHHVPRGDRAEILAELSRTLAPGGRVILLEGTPGWYRRATKSAAFRLGLLEEDTDIYGHLSADAMAHLVASEFEVIAERTLGSPLMVASVSESTLSKHLFPLYRRTQVVEIGRTHV